MTPSDEDDAEREPWEPTDEWIGVRIKNQWSERTFYSEGYRSGLAAGRAEHSESCEFERREWEAIGKRLAEAAKDYQDMRRMQGNLIRETHDHNDTKQKLAALVWQVEHDGCMASRAGETTYECRGDAPCALCRHRAERDTLRRRLAAALVDENTRLRQERDRYRAQALGLPEPDHD